LQAKNNTISFINGSLEAVNENNNSVTIPQINQAIYYMAQVKVLDLNICTRI